VRAEVEGEAVCDARYGTAACLPRALEQSDIMTSPRQADRGGEPRKPAANDRDAGSAKRLRSLHVGIPSSRAARGVLLYAYASSLSADAVACLQLLTRTAQMVPCTICAVLPGQLLGE
jgi:hypothetical protein